MLHLQKNHFSHFNINPQFIFTHNIVLISYNKYQHEIALFCKKIHNFMP